MKKGLDIIHIYAGTAGSAGLYIDAIYKSLSKDFTQECIVNNYFSFDYGRKFFYKFTEMSGPNYFDHFKLLRFGLRYLELVYGLLKSLSIVFFKRPKIVNYSLTSNLFVEYLFLLAVKKLTNTKLAVTCHDVVPFDLPYTSYDIYIKNRSKFFLIADFLIAHNENSLTDLNQFYGISTERVLLHKFPIMDLNKIFNANQLQSLDPKTSEIGNVESIKTPLIFSFVGHMRKEKGIEILLDAWRNFKGQAILKIIGNAPSSASFSVEKLSNIQLEKRFLSDFDYCKVINDSDFVILPYTKGTNSGIPSSVISLGVIPVTSDINMFLNNELLISKLFFKSGSATSLADKIHELSSLNSDEIKVIKRELSENLLNYSRCFDREVTSTYRKILDCQYG
jgi:glycosyltransferase involved in cell wall biosynthesis